MPSEAEASRDGADAAAAAPERTVLIVEDDRHSIDLLTLYLESEGFGVVVARDGVEGLELARKLRPRAVILDILLPRLDGWELLGRLKSEPSTAAIPVVVVSMLDERGKGFALGAAEYLVKPVAREDVQDLFGAEGRPVLSHGSGPWPSSSTAGLSLPAPQRPGCWPAAGRA